MAGRRSALITGITGQDGSYLVELLLSKGYSVHGIIRRSSTFNTQRINHLYVDPHEPDPNFYLHYGDLADPGILTDIIWNIKPNEVYHLGAQSHVRVSFDMPEYTGNTSGIGTTRILEAIRRSGVKSRFYQASSSEMFGASPPPQNETTAFYPRSPYAAAKLYAYWMTVNYREAYNLFACNGILFNHESPRRGETFVTRKITRSLANILARNEKKLYIGNLDAKRDWGFAPEYVEMMWLMLQQENPNDFVVGTGKTHSIRKFVEEAFTYAGVEIEWRGCGTDEVGIVKSRVKQFEDILKPGDTIVEIDARYFRPTEVDVLLADISKAKKLLGWESRVSFQELVRIMVDADMALCGLVPNGDGRAILVDKGINWIQDKSVLQSQPSQAAIV